MTERIGSSFEKREGVMTILSLRMSVNGRCRLFARLSQRAPRYWTMAVGQGRSGLDHARRGCRVTAYDLSPNMLLLAEIKAKQTGLDLEFISDVHQLTGRKWPIVTCIGVLDYYPDPKPLIREPEQYLEKNGRLIVTWPNALSPLGWFYFIGSRFTTPSTPRTPAFIRQVVKDAGMQMLSMLYAFPGWVRFGHTIVVEIRQST